MNRAPTTCDRFEDGDTALRYIAGQLSEPEAEFFESHYFGCPRCFAALQSAQAARTAFAAPQVVKLTARPSRKPLLWIGIAASLALAAVALWSFRATRPAPALSAATTTVSRSSLALLARFEAPEYENQALRGVSEKRAAAFRKAMTPYSAADYPAAAKNLQTFLAAYPDYVPARFYAGASELLSRDADRASADFASVLQSGNSGFAEEAHWGLANAALLHDDAPLARASLAELAKTNGMFAPRAAALLRQLDGRR